MKPERQTNGNGSTIIKKGTPEHDKIYKALEGQSLRLGGDAKSWEIPGLFDRLMEDSKLPADDE